MSRIFISAAHKSSGKTTISIGLCAALRQQHLQVQPFKKGPDYIDPMWLGAAAGRPCTNLDFYTMQHDEILQSFHEHRAGADISLIEGNKGLYDGLDLDGSNSNAALAKLLKAPVVLVLSARGMTRGIAPLILGYQAFDKDIHIAGVILNQLGGSRHESKLRQVIEHYTDVRVLGAVYQNPAMQIDERHLGLMPSNESDMAAQQIEVLANAITTQVNLDQIKLIAGQVPTLPACRHLPTKQLAAAGIRLGIARDAAFGFYYPDDLNTLKTAGVTLIDINMLHDQQLPDIDGLFIGGGFPETQMAALESNRSMRDSLRQAIENGLPCYAECGGLMYLARSIQWQDRQHEMVGIIPGDIRMHEKPQGRGYIRLRETGLGLWPVCPNKEEDICAHEFHYSSLDNLQGPVQYAYDVKRGTGIDGQHDGLVYKNLMACYAHMRQTRQSPWINGFIEFILQCKKDRGITT